MDAIQIGNFIKEQRKQKNLTQAQLAEELEISEKTVSKWECGNGLPDAALMLPLCEVLGVSANELLSGKKLTNNEYVEQAEQNLVQMKEAQDQSVKFLLRLEYVIGYLASIVFFTLIMVASLAEMAAYIRIILIVLGLVIFIVGVHFCLLIEKDAGYYECKHCHHKYVPTYKSVFLAPHVGRTRYMKCPKCNKNSWQKKAINKNES